MHATLPLLVRSDFPPLRRATSSTRCRSTWGTYGDEPPVLGFNGDFNWFNVADREFARVNQRVLANDAILGNVEAEFDSPAGDAGCGCAYPDSVDAAVVERSNQIHRQLKATANRHEHLRQRIAQLPMCSRYQVAGCRVGVVHGDADSLAGWRFDVAALADPRARPWLQSAFGHIRSYTKPVSQAPMWP